MKNRKKIIIGFSAIVLIVVSAVVYFMIQSGARTRQTSKPEQNDTELQEPEMSAEVAKPLNIVQVLPKQGAENIATDTAVIVTFDRNVSEEEFKFIFIPQTDFYQNISANVLTITPKELLAEGSWYSFRVLTAYTADNEIVYTFKTQGDAEKTLSAEKFELQTLHAQDKEFYLKTMPDTYLNLQTPYENELFSINSIHKRQPNDHYEFTVAYKTQNSGAGKRAVESWLKSLGFNSFQINTLKISYPQVEGASTSDVLAATDGGLSIIENPVQFFHDASCITEFTGAMLGSDSEICSEDNSAGGVSIDINDITPTPDPNQPTLAPGQPTPTPVPYNPKIYSLPGALTDSNLLPVADWETKLKARFPEAKVEYYQKIKAFSDQHGVSPAFLLALWHEETGASQLVVTEAGGAGKGRAKDHIGCHPKVVKQFDESLECFRKILDDPKKMNNNRTFYEFARWWCGPNQEKLCGNNPYFLRNFISIYQKYVPGGVIEL